jgi:rubrerythrin
MPEDTKLTTMFSKLAENEAALARLYSTYAELFPKKREFWSKLAHEEDKHARMINQVADNSLDDEVVDGLNLDLKLIQVSLDYIAEKQKQADTGDLSPKEAITIALGIETGILERGSFDFLTGRPIPEFDNLFSELVKDTRQHSEKIRAELSRKRWGGLLVKQRVYSQLASF